MTTPHLQEYRQPFRKKPRPREVDPAEKDHGMSEDAAELMRTVSLALRGFPEARKAVVSALEEAEKLAMKADR